MTTPSITSPASRKKGGPGKLLLGVSASLSIAAIFYFDVGGYLPLEGLKSTRTICSQFVFSYAGRRLGTINSLKEIVSPNLLTAFTLLELLALAPLLSNRFIGRSVWGATMYNDE